MPDVPFQTTFYCEWPLLSLFVSILYTVSVVSMLYCKHLILNWLITSYLNISLLLLQSLHHSSNAVSYLTNIEYKTPRSIVLEPILLSNVDSLLHTIPSFVYVLILFVPSSLKSYLTFSHSHLLTHLQFIRIETDICTFSGSNNFLFIHEKKFTFSDTIFF